MAERQKELHSGREVEWRSLGESDIGKSGVIPRRCCKNMDRPSYGGQERDEIEQSLQRI